MGVTKQRAAKEKPGVAAPKPALAIERVRKSKSLPTSEQFIKGILGGERAILAKAITLIESSRAVDREIAEQVIEHCLSHSGNSVRVGITGVPGAGKSSLIEALGRHLVVDRGERVAVLAVDPTSRVSGGSILGDKTRMSFLARSDQAFIRPSPARDSQGGIAQRTREVMLLCEAAGYGNILIETVGVGQSEVSVRDMVDFFLLVTLAGAGDELQGIKRGAMEFADAVVVNKADGANASAAERARMEAENALHFLRSPSSGWTAKAHTCSAITGAGIKELWDCILEHHAITRASGWLRELRLDQNRRWMHETLEVGLMQLFKSNPVIQRQLIELEKQVLAGQITAVRAGRQLLSLYVSEFSANVASGARLTPL